MAWTDWQEELYSRVPGAASDHIDQELKSTLREFFTKSGFWTEELDPINIVALTDTYTLTPTTGVVMGVQAAWVDNKQVHLISIKPKVEPTSPTTPNLGYCPQPNQLQLFPTPSVSITDGLKVLVRLNPSADFSDIPDEASSHFFDEIMDGVLGRLYSMPGKPFSNVVTAQYHLRRFRNGIASARDISRRRYSTAERGWSFPPWA
jgi:hypothetical protein